MTSVPREDGLMVRLAGWGRSVWLLLVAAVLVVVERVLVVEVGSPVLLLRVLSGVRDAWADPVVMVLALMGLLAEALAGYVLVVLALRWLSVLPGAAGRLAGRVSLLVTPAVGRRALDLLVGGTLLAQATLAAAPATPAGQRTPGPGSALAMSSSSQVAVIGPAAGSDGILAQAVLASARRRRPTDESEPGPARPTPRRSAAPLPPWLGGGPSNVVPGHTVEAGDTLWGIAAAHLPPSERSVGRIDRYWRQVYRANRPVVGADPDLIHPGTRLEVSPFRSDRR
jgi:LysM repeat protein